MPTPIGENTIALTELLALAESLPERGGGGATEPYIEETYDASGNLTDAVMHGYTKIRDYAFYNCSALESITFEGTPTTINGNAFTGCTNLLTINVPWAEGAVANAPWGATNATINYNYTVG